MQTDALELSKQNKKTGQSERLTWSVIELQVTNLERAVDFWTNALGLHVRKQDSQKAELGTSKRTLIVFHAGASMAVNPRHSGMYHVAIGMPDQNEFSRILARLIKKGIRISPTDHLASKSIYFSDPDGLEIEVVLETPERFDRFGDMSQGLIMYDVNGQPHSGREPLYVEHELTHVQDADLEAPLTDGTFLAHMHFKVPNLEAAAAWFEGIGFAKGLMITNWGFADMGAGGATSHSLAMNTWAGQNLPPAPDNMARLTHYELQVHDPEIMANAQGLEPSYTGLIGHDPAGTKISLIPAF